MRTGGGLRRRRHRSVILKEQKKLARHMVGQSSERVGVGGQSMGTKAEPSEVPTWGQQGVDYGRRELEFCLAVGRSRFKASSTVNCQL